MQCCSSPAHPERGHGSDGETTCIMGLSNYSAVPPQPILSEAMLEQFLQNEGLVPPGMNPETHLELLVPESNHRNLIPIPDTSVSPSLPPSLSPSFPPSLPLPPPFLPPSLPPSPLPQSLQLAVFLYTVCHVVVVVLDNMDSADPVFRSVAPPTSWVSS